MFVSTMRYVHNVAERQGKANQSTTPRTAFSLRRAALSGIPTQDTLQSSQGNSVGRGSNL